MFSFLLFILLFQNCSAVIYRLNASEYRKMPRIFGLDDYETCILDTNGTYCVADFEIFSRRNSSLMWLIQEYSKDTLKHFDHTKLHRGICVTNACQKFLRDEQNNAVDLNKTLEVCFNESLWNDYNLEAKLSNVIYCNRGTDEDPFSGPDYAIATIYFVIILLNIIGSLYHITLNRRKNAKENHYVLAFSIQRNWAKLFSSNVSSNPRIMNVKVFQSLRIMFMSAFIIFHITLVTMFSFIENTQYLEKIYDNLLNFILLNGTVTTSIFFVMSSFLLAYSFELRTAMTGVRWSHLPIGIGLRWIRLTPTLALTIATISTWMRRFGSGPLWGYMVTNESKACQQYWWANVLYINNYLYMVDDCLPQTWYLAADTQLFCFGLLVCVLARSGKARKILLAILLGVSLLVVGLQTYLQNLDGTVILSPEHALQALKDDGHFRFLYIVGHANLSAGVIGLACGFIVYHWQAKNKDFTNYKKIGYFLWLVGPFILMIQMMGILFFIEGKPPSRLFHISYAVFSKPLIQLAVTIVIISSIFKIKSMSRSVVEWSKLSWAAKLTYSVFLVHTCVLRTVFGLITSPKRLSGQTLLLYVTTIYVLSYVIAAMVWLCVEAPLANLTKALLRPLIETEREEEPNCKEDIVDTTL